MRSFALPLADSAALAIIILSPIAANAEPAPAAGPPVACSALADAPPAKRIESCTAVIDNPATEDSDRLDAMIFRAGGLHDGGAAAKALAEIHAVIARDPNRARAFRARGEILRQSGKIEAALEAQTQAIRLEPDNAVG